MARLLERRDDARGRVFILTEDPDTGDELRINLGRGFALGPDVVSRFEMIAGVSDVALSLFTPKDFRAR
jgi:DNA polymerase-3 subunit alpha